MYSERNRVGVQPKSSHFRGEGSNLLSYLNWPTDTFGFIFNSKLSSIFALL